MEDPGAKGEDDPARQRKKLWRLDAAASRNFGARDEDNKKLWRPGNARRRPAEEDPGCLTGSPRENA
jgi:hypothetical protein